MSKIMESNLFLKAARSRSCLDKAAEGFAVVRDKKLGANAPELYKARNLLRQGRAAYEESLADAKRLLGPIPAYVPDEIKAAKFQNLQDKKITVEGQTLEELALCFQSDPHIRDWINPEDIRAFLSDYDSAQQDGQRKVANLKVRIILDRLGARLAELEAFEKDVRMKAAAGL